MGLFGKFMDSMRIETVDDDEYYDDEEDVEEAPRSGIFGKNKNKTDDYDYDEPAEPEKKRLFGSKSQQVTPVRRQMEVIMIKPTAIVDGMSIADALLDGKTVVLNMEGIQTDLAQKILDFTSGSVYTMNGKLQGISHYIFIATPNQVELSGDFKEMVEAGQFDITGGFMRL